MLLLTCFTGFIDPLIRPFMDLINATNVYETTSSCSGRIAIFAEKRGDSAGCWLFVSHDPVELNNQNPASLFENELETIIYSETSPTNPLFESMQPVNFKFEPFILHIATTTVDQGQAMLAVAFDAGYRTSGLIHGKKRCVIHIKDTLKLDSPIGFYDASSRALYLVVREEYLEFLIKISNEKFQENQKRMKKLLDCLSKFCSSF
jgi:tRNA wybutosine-synthesizing protein 3